MAAASRPCAGSRLTPLGPRELRDRLRGVLEEADLHVEVVWAERTIDLTTGVQLPVDHAEARSALRIGR